MNRMLYLVVAAVFGMLGCNPVLSTNPAVGFGVASGQTRPEFGASFSISSANDAWQRQLEQLTNTRGIKVVQLVVDPADTQSGNGQSNFGIVFDALDICKRKNIWVILMLDVYNTSQEYRDELIKRCCGHPSVAIVQLGTRPFNEGGGNKFALALPKILAAMVEQTQRPFLLTFDGLKLATEVGDNRRVLDPEEIKAVLENYAISGNVKVRSQFRYFGIDLIPESVENEPEKQWKRLCRLSEAFRKANLRAITTVYMGEQSTPDHMRQRAEKALELGADIMLLDARDWFSGDEKVTKQWLKMAEEFFRACGR